MLKVMLPLGVAIWLYLARVRYIHGHLIYMKLLKDSLIKELLMGESFSTIVVAGL